MARGIILDKGRAREICLALVALGTIVVMPGASRLVYSALIKKIASQESPKERALKARRLKELEERRIIQVKPIGNDKVEVSFTNQGKELVRRYQFDEMKLPQPIRWDKKWRVISYDIPQRLSKASLALSRKFHQLNMFRIQKSIWVYPYACRDEIDAVCAVFEIDPEKHILYFETDRIPSESLARRHFDLG